MEIPFSAYTHKNVTYGEVYTRQQQKLQWEKSRRSIVGTTLEMKSNRIKSNLMWQQMKRRNVNRIRKFNKWNHRIKSEWTIKVLIGFGIAGLSMLLSSVVIVDIRFQLNSAKEYRPIVLLLFFFCLLFHFSFTIILLKDLRTWIDICPSKETQHRLLGKSRDSLRCTFLFAFEHYADVVKRSIALIRYHSTVYLFLSLRCSIWFRFVLFSMMPKQTI